MRETIITDDGHVITRMELNDLEPMTQREKDMLREAKARPIEFDEDCPPLSPAMLKEAERMISANARRA
ncbi:MAG: hypothetical protein ACSW8J_04220 [bacterium]